MAFSVEETERTFRPLLLEMVPFVPLIPCVAATGANARVSKLDCNLAWLRICSIIRDAISNRLVIEGYYTTRPDRIRILYAAKGVFLGLVMAVAGAVLASTVKMQPMPLIGIGLLTGAIVLGFGLFLPGRTSAGAQTLAKVLGFREFLSRVEKDHIARLEKTPELFERYLPYAMALGVENRWTQMFGNITMPPPQWYQSNRRDGFLPMHLTNDLNHMSSQAASALAPSLRTAGVTDKLPDSSVS